MPRGEVRIEYMPLSKLRRWPRNPKDHDLGTLHQSISRFGFVSPIIIDERTGKLVAGHGRLDVLQQKKVAGEKPPARIKEVGDEWYVPVIRGISFNSDEEAEAYAIADNRTTELGGWDEVQLAEVLSDLAAADALEGVGWDRDDVDQMLKLIGDKTIEGGEGENSLTEEMPFIVFSIEMTPETWEQVEEDLVSFCEERGLRWKKAVL